MLSVFKECYFLVILLVLLSKCTCITKQDKENVLIEIRNLMNEKEIQAYYVPMSDAHQSEYVAEQDKRLQYVSGFSGSAGEGIITLTNCTLWTDSRYHLQAEQEIDSKLWTLMKSGEKNVPNIISWLKENLPSNSTIGVDPYLISANKFSEWNDELKGIGKIITGLNKNLIDEIWTDRPLPKPSSIFPLDVTYSGEKCGKKILKIMDEVQKRSAGGIILSRLDDIAWLLNLRGSDIDYNPVFFSYAILIENKTYLLVNQSKINEEIKLHFQEEEADIELLDYGHIKVIIENQVKTNNHTIIMSTDVSEAVSSVVPEQKKLYEDIVSAVKSVKNIIEAKNMNAAHIRDGLAVIEYLHWLNKTIDEENVTEISGATKLTEFRRQQDLFKDLSFSVISAVGKHSSMPHYSPAIETDFQITRENIYLVDSGGHYLDGTTDVTRTVHFGVPKTEEKACFTRVLKGFIAITTSVFPRLTPISYFDNIARRALWQAGLDYGHGTGHGVGMYLAVHEYPPLMNSKSKDVMKVNMFTSNEPGYYKNNDFGIRIEDVIQVVESEMENAFNGEGALTFRSITYVPIQTSLIDLELLTKEEVDFVNEYNHRVFRTISPILLKRRMMDTYLWLREQTFNI